MIDSDAAARAWLVDCLGVDEAAMGRLALLVEMLVAENLDQNLVSKGSLDHVWQRHIVDSAQLLHVSRETASGASSWLDLGTGAGFPGLVIAALQPERDVVLVDSRRLRTDWLHRASRALGLHRVQVVLAKVQDMPSRKFGVISARAFAPLERLLSLSVRFSTPETLWLLPKGAKARHELQELGNDCYHSFHVEQSLTDPTAGILVGHVSATTTRLTRKDRSDDYDRDSQPKRWGGQNHHRN